MTTENNTQTEDDEMIREVTEDPFEEYRQQMEEVFDGFLEGIRKERKVERRLRIAAVLLLPILAFITGSWIGGHWQISRIQASIEERGFAAVHQGMGALAFSKTHREALIIGLITTWPWAPARVRMPPYFQLAFYDDLGCHQILTVGKPIQRNSGDKTHGQAEQTKDEGDAR